MCQHNATSACTSSTMNTVFELSVCTRKPPRSRLCFEKVPKKSAPKGAPTGAQPSQTSALASHCFKNHGAHASIKEVPSARRNAPVPCSVPAWMALSLVKTDNISTSISSQASIASQTCSKQCSKPFSSDTRLHFAHIPHEIHTLQEKIVLKKNS